MKQPFANKQSPFVPLKMMLVIVMILSIFLVANSSFIEKGDGTGKEKKFDDNKKDSVKSVEAFDEVYKVLMHPRCMNCHPKGDVPLQGNDSLTFSIAGADPKNVPSTANNPVAQLLFWRAGFYFVALLYSSSVTLFNHIVFPFWTGVAPI